MQKIIAQESRQIILGHWAENEAVCVEFDITGWEKRYGAGGHFDVLAKRQGDADYYPCHTQREGNMVLWFISSADTAVVGQGSCGLVYRVGNVVAKSVIFTTVVTEGVTNGGEVPEPWEDWTDSVLQAGAGILQSASDASQAAANAATSAASAMQSASAAGSAASAASNSATSASASAASAESSATEAAFNKNGSATHCTAASHYAGLAESAYNALLDTDAAATTLAPGSRATAEWKTDPGTGARTLTIGVPSGAAGVGAVHYDEAQSLTDEQQGQARTNIGLGSVDNTSDANKPVSTAQQVAISLKADKTALSRTDRSLAYLWKKSKGILYDTEAVHSNANTVTVPSGAMEYASMDMVGGLGIKVDGVDHLINAKVDKVVSTGIGGTTTIEKSIPQSVIALCPDYGIGVNADCYNYIDWVEKKYHHKVSSVDLGVAEWQYGSGSQRFISNAINRLAKKPPNANTLANIVCEGLAIDTANGTYFHTIDNSISLGYEGALYAYSTAYGTDSAAFKAAMSGVYLYYELAAEEVIDLSSVIPEDFEILPVEAGGTIQFHYPELDNGYSIDVPNDVTYMMNVAEVTV